MLMFAMLFLVPIVSGYECSDGCVLEDSYMDDNFCDCSDCGEEPNWNCDSCLCPTSCGSYFECGGGNGTTAFVCDDGCEIATTYTNDSLCDCSNCEDESTLTCAECGGCPTECGSYVACDGDNSTSGSNSTTSPEFICDDGCEIAAHYENDDYCDCKNCEDESAWSCASCGGCPPFCGYSFECSVGPHTTDAPQSTAGFTCDDGCGLPADWVGDDYCDCSNCEDETVWDCASCGGCPTECSDYSNKCEGVPLTTAVVLTTGGVPTTESPTTEAPTTEAHSTEAPTTEAPATTHSTGPTRINEAAAVRLLLAAALSLLSAMAL